MWFGWKKLNNNGNQFAVSRHMVWPSRIAFRLTVSTFACVLGILGTWVFVSEIIRPALPFFPLDHDGSEIAAAGRFRASAAASIGVIRGDLWADDVIALSSSLPGEALEHGEVPVPATIAGMRATADRAAWLAPHDSRIWLLLALIDFRLKAPNPGVAELLKMSYYTSPYDERIIPVRIVLATRINAIVDPEFQDLIGGEIRFILSRKPELRSSIVDAYRDAVPEAKKLIESTVGELDPSFLASIRTNDRSQ